MIDIELVQKELSSRLYDCGISYAPQSLTSTKVDFTAGDFNCSLTQNGINIIKGDVSYTYESVDEFIKGYRQVNTLYNKFTPSAKELAKDVAEEFNLQGLDYAQSFIDKSGNMVAAFLNTENQLTVRRNRTIGVFEVIYSTRRVGDVAPIKLWQYNFSPDSSGTFQFKMTEELWRDNLERRYMDSPLLKKDEEGCYIVSDESGNTIHAVLKLHGEDPVWDVLAANGQPLGERKLVNISDILDINLLMVTCSDLFEQDDTSGLSAFGETSAFDESPLQEVVPQEPVRDAVPKEPVRDVPVGVSPTQDVAIELKPATEPEPVAEETPISEAAVEDTSEDEPITEDIPVDEPTAEDTLVDESEPIIEGAMEQPLPETAIEETEEQPLPESDTEAVQESEPDPEPEPTQEVASEGEEASEELPSTEEAVGVQEAPLPESEIEVKNNSEEIESVTVKRVVVDNTVRYLQFVVDDKIYNMALDVADECGLPAYGVVDVVESVAKHGVMRTEDESRLRMFARDVSTDLDKCKELVNKLFD